MPQLATGQHVHLAIDIGNTNTVIGVHEGDGAWLYIWRFSTVRSTMGADWAPAISALAIRDEVDLKSIRSACLASVVPIATAGMSDFCIAWCGVDPLIVSSNLQLNVRLDMERPDEVGVDRIANAVAARYMRQDPTIVVDLGTATKIEAITADGTFLGGSITIGLGVSIDALAARASRLFSMDLKLPDHPIGRNTTEALQSGIVLGHRHLITGLIADMRTEIGAEALVVLTGGHARQLGTGFLPNAQIEPDLTLNGIRIIHELNMDSANRP